MKPPFGTLNATLAKTIAENTPKHTKLVEPFADGGTLALYLQRKKSREHIVNIVDEELFTALSFVQGMSGGDRSTMKRFDWIGSQETFDKVSKITAKDGPEFLYKFLYIKKFGTKAGPDEPPIFDVLRTGHDKSSLLYGLPLMKVGLKGVTIINEDPISVMGKGGDFFVLLPKKPEDVDAVKSKIKSISGQFIFMSKIKDPGEAIDMAKQLSKLNVTVIPAASIMMASISTVWNYEGGRLSPLSDEVLNAAGSGGGKASGKFSEDLGSSLWAGNTDFERDMLREYYRGKQTIIDEFGNPIQKRDALHILDEVFAGITARQAVRVAEHLDNSFFVGLTLAGEKVGTGFAFDEVNRRHLNRITKETIGKIGDFNEGAMKQLSRKYAELDYEARTVNLISDGGWNKTVEARLKKIGLTPEELDIIKHQTTTNKMVSILEQRGMRAGVHPDEVAKELRPYVRGFFGGAEKVVIDNTGKIRKVLQVTADGDWKFVDRVVTRPYTTNIKAYSRLVARHSMADAQNTGYRAGIDESGLAKGWIYTAVMDSKTRPEHAMLHGKHFKRGEGPLPPLDGACRCWDEIDPKSGVDIPVRSDTSYERERDKWFFKQKSMKDQKIPSMDFLKKGTLEKMPKSPAALREIRKEVLG